LIAPAPRLRTTGAVDLGHSASRQSSIRGNPHQHIHKENNVLFPKAIRREAELAGGGA